MVEPLRWHACLRARPRTIRALCACIYSSHTLFSLVDCSLFYSVYVLVWLCRRAEIYCVMCVCVCWPMALANFKNADIFTLIQTILLAENVLRVFACRELRTFRHI